jgi:hypothetical protein
MLAHHCAQAGLTENAVGYWLKAGQQAIARNQRDEHLGARLGSDILDINREWICDRF